MAKNDREQARRAALAAALPGALILIGFGLGFAQPIMITMGCIVIGGALTIYFVL